MYKVIAFDADDTLWLNETVFRKVEEEFCNLLIKYSEPQHTEQTLIVIELKNLEVYGYGVKGFLLSMIETALLVSNGKVEQKIIDKIINLGKGMLEHPIELLDGVAETLEELKQIGYKMIVVTKGDLLEQQRKLERSNISHFFHHVEVLSDKKEKNYLQLLKTLDINPSDFVMVGNSLKSDILPIVNIGGNAIYIPFHTTWVHEEIKPEDDCPDKYTKMLHISELIGIIKNKFYI